MHYKTEFIQSLPQSYQLPKREKEILILSVKEDSSRSGRESPESTLIFNIRDPVHSVYINLGYFTWIITDKIF